MLLNNDCAKHTLFLQAYWSSVKKYDAYVGPSCRCCL